MAAGLRAVTWVWSRRCSGHIWVCVYQAGARCDLCVLPRATLMGGLGVWAVALALLGASCLAEGHKSSKRGSAGAAGTDHAATPAPRSTVREHQTRSRHTPTPLNNPMTSRSRASEQQLSSTLKAVGWRPILNPGVVYLFIFNPTDLPPNIQTKIYGSPSLKCPQLKV